MRSSDSRIILSLIVNIGFIVLGAYIGEKIGDGEVLMLGLLAYLGSHNLFLCMGVKRPFKSTNQQALDNEDLLKSIFGGIKDKKTENNDQRIRIFIMVKKIADAIICIAVLIILYGGSL